MPKTFRLLTLLVVSVLGCGAVGQAQSIGGHIAGVITDEQNRPVRDVYVTAHGTDQSQRMKTDAKGQFMLRDLVAGRYVLTAALDGYTTVVRNGVMVRGSRTQMLSIEMKVAVAADAQVPLQAPVRSSRFRGLTETFDGTLPSYNPVESLPPSTAVLIEAGDAQIRR